MQKVESRVEDIAAAVKDKVEEAYWRGWEQARAEILATIGQANGKALPAPVEQKSDFTVWTGPANTTLGGAKPRKSGWSNYTPEQRLARVNAIRKGRGLPLRKAL